MISFSKDLYLSNSGCVVMEILDKNFIKLPKKRQLFVVGIASGHITVAILGLSFKMTTVIESFFLSVIGILYAEILKLQYRIESLENKKK
jgi:hypothetical protein